ncbi:MAG: bifunctional nuclease family protein [Candidatus Brocadiia bacterium]
MVEVELSRIIINERSDQQVIVLKEKQGQRAFPILIGIYEATAIDRGIKEYRTPRPLTHDLICSILKGLNVTLQRTVVSDMRNRTFYATLILEQNGRTLEVDSRPSDAIAISVQFGTPIFVEEKVFEEVSKDEEQLGGEPKDLDEEEGEEEEK